MSKIKAYQIDILPTNANKVVGVDPTTNLIPVNLIPTNSLPITPKRYKRGCVISGPLTSLNILSGGNYSYSVPFFLSNNNNNISIKANTSLVFSKNENDYFVNFSSNSQILTIPTIHPNTSLYLYASLTDINNSVITYSYSLCPPSFSFANPELTSMIPPLQASIPSGYSITGSSTPVGTTSIYNLFNRQIGNYCELGTNGIVQLLFPTNSQKPIRIYSYSIKVADSNFPTNWSFYGIKSDNSIELLHNITNLTFIPYEEKFFICPSNTNNDFIGFKIMFNNTSNIKIINLNVYGSENICINTNTFSYYQYSPNNQWTEISQPRIYLGELLTSSNGQINTIIPYAYNGYVATGWINIKQTDSFLLTHNIGFPPLNIKAIARINTSNSTDINNISFNTKYMDFHYFPIDLIPYNSGFSINYVTRHTVDLSCKNLKALDLNNSVLYNTDIMFFIDRGW